MTMAQDFPCLDGLDGPDELPPPVPPKTTRSSQLPLPLQEPLLPLPATQPTNPSPSVHTTGGLAGGGDEMATMRLQYLERMVANLVKEKTAMEEEFGRQRKKFMDRMLQSDTEHTVLKSTVEKFSREVQDLNTQLRHKDDEMRDVQTAVKVMETTHREAFDADRVKYEEEIASLSRILDVQTQQQQSELQHEREAFEKERLALLARLPPGSTPPPSTSSDSSSPAPTLETSMRKAVEESKLLKAVVVPLEEEIDLLRLKLSDAENTLRVYEGGERREEVEREGGTPLIDLTSPLPPEQLQISNTLTPSPTESSKHLQLLHQLELERVARQDLEMHTKVLELQKAALQEESEALQKTVEKMNTELGKEKENYEGLKKTWELANQHFIVSQDQLKQHIYQLQQTRQIAEQSGSAKTEEEEEEGRTQGLLRVPGKIAVSALRTHKRSQSSEYQTAEQTTPDLCAGRRSRSWSELHIRSGGREYRVQVDALESELKRVRKQLEQRVLMCDSYEAQLQRVQEQMIEEVEEKERELVRLRLENRKVMAGVMRERKAKEELRRKIVESREEFMSQSDKFEISAQTLGTKMRGLKEQYTQSKHDAQRDLARFSDERVQLFSQIRSAQDEYDCLKVVQSEETHQFSRTLAEAKKTEEKLEGRVKELQAVVQSQRTEREAMEEKLGSEVSLLHENLLAEQIDNEKKDIQMTRQLEAARKEIATLKMVREELQQERTLREEALASRTSVEEKSRQFIEEQHRKFETEVAGRQATEQHVRDLQRQVTSLKSQLDTSQENQMDFVALSQKLQIRLAELEEQQEALPPPPPPPPSSSSPSSSS